LKSAPEDEKEEMKQLIKDIKAALNQETWTKPKDFKLNLMTSCSISSD